MVELEPTKLHDGSLMSCDEIKQWARARGFDFISVTNFSGASHGFAITIRAQEKLVIVNPGDKVAILQADESTAPFLTVVESESSLH